MTDPSIWTLNSTLTREREDALFQPSTTRINVNASSKRNGGLKNMSSNSEKVSKSSKADTISCLDEFLSMTVSDRNIDYEHDSLQRDDQNTTLDRVSHSSRQRDTETENRTSISDFKDISFPAKKSNRFFRKSSNSNSFGGVPFSPDDPNKKQLKVLTPIKSVRRRISNLSSSGKCTKGEERDANIDMDIGRRLALPDKLDIMVGREAPGSAQKKENEEFDGLNTCLSSGSYQSPTPQKKLIMLPDEVKSPGTPLVSLRKSMAKIHSKKMVRSSQKSFKITEPEVESIDTDDVDYTTQAKKLVLRSSEMDPSVHQITIPSATDFLVHARVCALMEGYDRLLEVRAKAKKRWFNFEQLVGRSRVELEAMYLEGIGKKPNIPIFVGGSELPGPPPLPPGGNPFGPIPIASNPFDPNPTYMTDEKSLSIASSNNSSSLEAKKGRRNGHFVKKNPSEIKVVKPHPSTIKSLLECADDVLVEGYFSETITNHNTKPNELPNSTIVQATIFSSQRARQFIVCYRGSMGQHTKPVKHNERQKNSDGEPCTLHPDNPIPINPTFRDTYFESNLEPKVFEALEKLSGDNPFCDVTFTGHSFGAGLSILASVRFADRFPMMTVSCITFGAPKIGGMDLRHFGNSLPNLKVMRVEYGNDPFVDMPEGPKWEHIGHSISINTESIIETTRQPSTKGEFLSPSKKNKKNTTGSSKSKSCQSFEAEVKAFKFGVGKKSSKGHSLNLARGLSSAMVIEPSRNKKFQSKFDHEMRSYLHGIELFTHMGLPWISQFVGEEGGGIVSEVDNETRHVV